MIFLQKIFGIFLLGVFFVAFPSSSLASVYPSADLSVSANITNFSGNESIPSGENVRFRINVKNNGPEDVENAILKIVHGKYFENVKEYPSNCTITPENLECNFSNFDNGESDTVEFSADLKEIRFSEEGTLNIYFTSRTRDGNRGNDFVQIPFTTKGKKGEKSKFYPYEPIREPITSVYRYQTVNGEYVDHRDETRYSVQKNTTPSGNYWDTEWSKEYPVIENSRTAVESSENSSSSSFQNIRQGDVSIDLFTSGSSVISGDSIVFTANIKNTNSFPLQNLVAENYFPKRDFVILSSIDQFTESGDTLRFTKNRLNPGKNWKIRIIARAKNKSRHQAIRVVDHIVVTADDVDLQKNSVSTGLFISPQREISIPSSDPQLTYYDMNGNVISREVRANDPKATNIIRSNRSIYDDRLGQVRSHTGSGASEWIFLGISLSLGVMGYYFLMKRRTKLY